MEFFLRSNVGSIPTSPWRTSSGDVPLSSPEATCLDVVTDPHIAGGIDNAANVIIGLADENVIDPDRLASLRPLYPIAAFRRVGWILNNHTSQKNLDKLRSILPMTQPSVLTPDRPRIGHIDLIWNLQLNIELEVEA